MNPVIDFPWKKQVVAADALVYAGPCILHSINFNGMTAVGDLSVYDGISNAGNIIAVLTLRSAVQVSCQPFTMLFDCEMEDGIYLDFDATLTANFTVMYR